MKALSGPAVAIALPASAASSPDAGRVSRSEGDPRWSPDGRSVLLAREDDDGRPALWVARADGPVTRRLRRNVSSAAWSPDGRSIAFVRVRRSDARVFLVRPDGSGLRPLVAAR